MLATRQTLNLSWCSKLTSLPAELERLASLQLLNLDGCSALCRNENDYQFQGTAQGGSITFVIDGFQVVLLTSAGQTAAEVASAMAAAINANTDLSSLGATAAAVGSQVVVAGGIDSVTIGDSGLVADLPLSPIGIPFLLVGLMGSALLVLRRSPLARRSRR